ncbi:MAG: aldose 1-epimerase family protein [Pedobacter sp.]|nr:MAG: aldose 1-epimerase family protein [Pedobacter sp.]
MVIIENEQLKVVISLQGAELQSLFHKPSNSERLWSGDPAFWGKRSPVLFPIVGALKNDSYFYKDKEYHLPRHGFARDHNFILLSKNAEEAVFSLADSDDTLNVFPFRFEFIVNYRLVENTLVCAYSVINQGSEEMLFSLGAHPAFAVNTEKGIRFSDHYIQFNKEDVINVHKIVNNLISNECAGIKLKDRSLKLDHALFYNDALVMKNLKSDRLSLLNICDGSGLHFSFKDFPFFGIWSATDADFICLEPWCGIADGVGHDQQLENKEGIVKLDGGSDFKRSWEVTCF